MAYYHLRDRFGNQPKAIENQMRDYVGGEHENQLHFHQWQGEVGKR